MVESLDTTLPFLSDSYLCDNGQLFGDSSAYYVQLHLKVCIKHFALVQNVLGGLVYKVAAILFIVFPWKPDIVHATY